jgi:hypothetical protein
VPRFRVVVRSGVVGSTMTARVGGVQFHDDDAESVVRGGSGRHYAIPANNHSPSPPATAATRVSPPMPQCSGLAATKVGISTAAA